jgi:hypothetical protein
LNDLDNGVLFRKLNVSHLLWSRDCSKLLVYHRIIRLKYTNSQPLFWLETEVSGLHSDLEFKKTNEDQFPFKYHQCAFELTLLILRTSLSRTRPGKRSYLGH